MLLRLGLNDETGPAGTCPETGSLPFPADPCSSLDEAIQQLAQSEPEVAEPASVAEAAEIPKAVPEDAAEAVAYWLAHYKANPAWAARNIRELVAKAPERVVEAVLPLYQSGSWGEAAPLLARLLSTLDTTAEKLCDPAASLESSVSIAKAVMQYEPSFDARFARSLLDDDQMTEAARQRGLAVMQKLGGGRRLIPILIQFLRDPDSRIRSKAALMFGQIMPPQGIMDRLMGDADARVRANFVEGLWNCSSNDCQPLFRQALEDSNHRVMGNALVGLHRMGESREVMRHLGRMVRRPEALFRAAAAWVIGRTGEERYASVLRHMARDADPMVRRGALRSLRQIRTASAVGGNPQSGSPGDRSAR